MKENEVKIFSVIVDAEGTDKWLADGVFVDKPKLKTEVQPKGVNEHLVNSIIEAIGLNKEGVILNRAEVNHVNSNSMTISVHYYPRLDSYEMRTKTIHVYN